VSETLSRRLAELEGAESALVLASGMAAIACTLLALLRPGDHLLASAWLRPASRRFFERELPALGVDVTFVDPRETRGWRKNVARNTRALFLESPVTANARVVDLKPPRMLAQELGIALIVDATAATPVNFTPLRHGADVVVHDARYVLDAHGAHAGVVCGTEGVVDEVREKMRVWGSMPHPAALVQLEQALSTLELRVQRQNANALALAQWAASSPVVRDVHYPGLPEHADHALAAEVQTGFGGIVVLRLADDAAAERAHRRFAAAAGENELTATVMTAGESPSTVRVDVGLEQADAIIAAVALALE
jgi:cystathionine beta-lyase/cystathionine gamma-synthase